MLESAIIVLDTRGKIVYFSPGTQKITGFEAEEVLNKDLDVLVPTELKEWAQLSISSAMLRNKEGTNVEGEVEVLRFIDLSQSLGQAEELYKSRSFMSIVSTNRAMLQIFKILPHIAKSDAAVLITGESGTGKELIASALHNLSSRNGKPFVTVNCGALPDTLLESELFGYKAGAFTDAKKDKSGRFKLAEGGTIFLDEIGDMSPATQVKILRVLETKEYEPLGGTRLEKANVRIISATNRDLGDRIKSGYFRQDLYYRVNLFSINVIPLRERPEDIPLLIEYYREWFNRLMGRCILGFTKKALDILLSHNYPGNVRELKNILEYAFVICRRGERIGPENLPLYLLKDTSDKRNVYTDRTAVGPEEQIVLEALRKHGGRIDKAAQELGVHRVTLWRIRKKLQLMKD
jgi:transcriptional regulator with PAS, ATPase and Fis domain